MSCARFLVESHTKNIASLRRTVDVHENAWGIPNELSACLRMTYTYSYVVSA